MSVVLQKRPKNVIVSKFKLKTKKAAQKRFSMIGGLRDKGFMYHSQGHRHLNRNKSAGNRRRHISKRHTIDVMRDQKKLRRLMPYFKKRKSMRVWTTLVTN